MVPCGVETRREPGRIVGGYGVAAVRGLMRGEGMLRGGGAVERRRRKEVVRPRTVVARTV